MSQTEIIIVKNLTKKYGDFTAVNDISFSVYENEVFGFLGPNGAGKTTTLEIIETLREETSGTVKVGGYTIDDHPEKVKSIIGVQLQSSSFYPNLTLIEILNLFAGLYNVKVNARELLERVELADKSKSKITELSGGQKQRFSVASTLVHQPPILFLDEPSTGLDPQARHNLWELIKEIQDQGTTIVLTTHFMDEAEYLCDRVAIIDEGKILNVNTPDSLIDQLLEKGFKKPTPQREATLEDVFLDLTGKELRE
jgi:ABC-2 type transport system ATP-binding protein